MLHDIINERGNCRGVRDGISEENNHMYSNKSLASGALILEFVVIAGFKPVDSFYRCYKSK